MKIFSHVTTKVPNGKLKGKWKVLIILSLYNMPQRFNKLKQLTMCNANSLSKNLKQLEARGIVSKIDGPYNKYRLTKDGAVIAKLIIQLDEALSKLGH